MFQPIYHVSVGPTDGNGPTQGQRKTLNRVGFEPTTFTTIHSSYKCCTAMRCLSGKLQLSKSTRLQLTKVDNQFYTSLVETNAACN